MRAIIALAMLLAATGRPRAAEINVMLTDRYGHVVRRTRAAVRARQRPHDSRGATARPAAWCGGSTPASPPTSSSSTTAARRTDQAGQAAARPHRPHAHRHRHLPCARARRKPDVSTPDALKRALLAAKIDRPHRPGRRRHHRRADHRDVREVRHRRRRSPPRPSSPPAARTAASARSSPTAKPRSACSMVSELLSNPDVEVIGMLPPELQHDHDLFRRRHRQRQRAGRREGADPLPRHARGAGDLQGQGTGTVMPQERHAHHHCACMLLITAGTSQRRRDQGADHHRDAGGDRRARAAVRTRQRPQGDGQLRSVRRPRPEAAQWRIRRHDPDRLDRARQV